MFGVTKASLDERQEKAIQLFIDKAYDKSLTDEKIAKEVGVSRQTLYDWKKIPMFNDELIKRSDEANRSALVVARTEAQRMLTNDKLPPAVRAKLIELVYKENGKLKDVQQSSITVDHSDEVKQLIDSYNIK